jgi:long-chain fatty acid transport protein
MQAIVSLVFLALAAGRAEAGGLYLYELGTEDVGLANAGIAARAQDASVVANNPAGMTRLEGNQLVVGAQLLYGDVEYTLDNSSLAESGNIVGWLPGGSLFYSHSFNDDLKIGAAFYGNFGLSMSFDDNWAGHNLAKDVTLMGLTLQPTVAYRMNDKWSVGAGLGINYGIFSLSRDRLNINGGGEIEQDDTDIVANVKLGILFELSEKTRFGLTYASEVDYSFDVDATGTLPITGNPFTLPIGANVNTPQQLMFSAVQVLNNKWTLLGNIGWQDWSAFGESEVTVGANTLVAKLDIQDTWHGAMGVQYQLAEATRLNFGVAYDSSMYNSQSETSLLLPTGAAWRFGAGAQHQLNEKSSFGAAFEYVASEDSTVISPAVLSGSYDDPRMYFFSVNYSYRF